MKRFVLKICHGITYLFFIAAYFSLFPFAILFFGHRNYWLVSEIDFDARDNGYCFFKYLRLNHKEINAIYIISKKNINYSNVKCLGKTIEPGSFKHLFLFLCSKALISTIVNGCAPNKYYLKFFRRHHPIYGKCINLKHGIYKDFSINDTKKLAKCDLVICGGYPEYNYILSNYGYSKIEVAYTGLARFDDLKVAKSNTIMIMPTWRRWLDGLSKRDFLLTDFYKSWVLLIDSLLNDNDLLDYNFLFFVHPKMNPFLGVFTNSSSRIAFMSTKDSDIQKQIINSCLLITDYSSVFFDFAYMEKPVVYYQFDANDFYEKHYKKTYFDYKLHGFGDVCLSTKEVLNSIHSSLRVTNEIYLERSRAFFKLHDNKNCERIYLAILECIHE